MDRFKAACIQMTVNPFNYQSNIEKALNFINKAIEEHDPKLLVFAETITTGFGIRDSAEDLYDSIDSVPGNLTYAICEKAAKEKIYIVWPTYERGEKRGIVYNSVLLINDRGEIVGNYKKTHPFPTERIDNNGWTTPGNEVVVVDTPIAKIGMICCYDGDFPELSRVCAINGAEVIVRPSAFLRSFEIWELTNKARAYDNHVYVIATNSVGPDALGNNYFGHSMIVSPTAQTLALCRGSEEIVSAELDPNPLACIGNGSLAPMLFNHMEDRNIEVYSDILQQANSNFPRYTELPQEAQTDKITIKVK